MFSLKLKHAVFPRMRSIALKEPGMRARFEIDAESPREEWEAHQQQGVTGFLARLAMRAPI